MAARVKGADSPVAASRLGTIVSGTVLLWAVCVLALPRPAAGQSAAARTVAAGGTLRVSFLATNPVQGRIDPQTREVTGPVADLTRALAARLGVPYEIVPVPNAAALIGSITTRRTDVGFLAWDAERARQVAFSAPYALMGSAYLVNADSPFTRSADLDRVGVTVGAVAGTSQGIWVGEHVTRAQTTMVPAMPPHAELVAMLASGRVTAFAANRQRLEEAAATSPRVRVLSDNFTVVGQALVAEQSATARLEELNRFVSEAIASGLVRRSLTQARLAGVEPAPLPRR